MFLHSLLFSSFYLCDIVILKIATQYYILTVTTCSYTYHFGIWDSVVSKAYDKVMYPLYDSFSKYQLR